MSDQTRLLVTGFGPFPNVPVNASSALAAEVTKRLRTTQDMQAHAVAYITLATHWIDGPARLRSQIAQCQPDAVLMFGVSRRARGLVLESRAQNIRASADVSAQEPDDPLIAHDGPRHLIAPWPARRLAAHLRRRGFPVSRSRNAGRYLCNRVLYETIHAQSATGVMTCGFVHIPQMLAEIPNEDGDLAARDGLPVQQTPKAPRLTWDDAVSAGVHIALAVLNEAETARRFRAR